MNYRKIFKIIFIVYSVLILIFVAVKFTSLDAVITRFNSIKRRREYGIITYNLIPLKSIKSQLKFITSSWGMKNFFGNIGIFIPLGLLMPASFAKIDNAVKSISACLGYIVMIEVFQFVTMLGVFDVDDIILNFVGSLIGFLLFLIAENLYLNSKNTDR